MAHSEYRFSPIEDNTSYTKALEYVVIQATHLVREVIGYEIPADTLTLFAHYDQEYGFLEQSVRQAGSVSPLSHGPTLYVDTDMIVAGQHIKILGARQPDPDRPQVGYADYPVADFAAMQRIHIDNPLVRFMRSGNGMELLEIRHPDFDVLGYIVSTVNHPWIAT